MKGLHTHHQEFHGRSYNLKTKKMDDSVGEFVHRGKRKRLCF